MKNLPTFNEFISEQYAINEAKDPRPIYLIAQEIMNDWTHLSVHAASYLHAMTSLDKIEDKYGMEDGSSIITYFLANAGGWKGPKAKEIKKELKSMVDVFYKEQLKEDFLVCTGDYINDFLNEIKPMIGDAYQIDDNVLKFLVSGDEETVNKYDNIARKYGVKVKFEV